MAVILKNIEKSTHNVYDSFTAMQSPPQTKHKSNQISVFMQCNPC